jgi:hypothetical protein
MFQLKQGENMNNQLKTACMVILSMVMLPGVLFSQGKMKDEEAIRNAALDYIQGWYDADGARMQRALHPDLAKRGLVGDSLQPISAAGLVDLARNGMGKNQPGKKEKVITVLDIADTIATVKVVSDQYIDYLHLGKVDGKWVIINVLWAYKKQ